MTKFEVDPPAAATVVENTTGFSKTEDGTYKFGGQPMSPTLTYRVRTGFSANESYASGRVVASYTPSVVHQTRVHHTPKAATSVRNSRISGTIQL